jgi:hypothetical protein
MRVRDVCSRIHLGGSGCSWYSIGACKTPWQQFQGETVPNTVCPSLVLLVLCVFCSNILYVSRLMLREYWSCGNLISIAFHRRMSRLQVIERFILSVCLLLLSPICSSRDCKGVVYRCSLPSVHQLPLSVCSCCHKRACSSSCRPVKTNSCVAY